MAPPIDYSPTGMDTKLHQYAELRGCAGWEADDLPVTTQNDTAAKLLDLSFRAAFTRSAPRYAALDGAKVAAAAVEADPSCSMAHITALALRLIGASKAAPHVQPSLAAATAACAVASSVWERRHLHVLTVYASADDSTVGDLYNAIVEDYPFDTLALSLAFIRQHTSNPEPDSQGCFSERLLGNADNSPARRAALLENTVRMLPEWTPSSGQPGDLYPFLLAEHAYSLGECERYEESEVSVKSTITAKKSTIFCINPSFLVYS